MGTADTKAGPRLSGTKLWWLYLVLALSSGTMVADHLLPVVAERLAVIDERGYQERFGSRRRQRITSTINATILRLSDGTVLQLSSLGDWIVPGDTLEVQRTPMLKEKLQYRKAKSRARDWLLVDSNKLDFRIYPYIVFACSFLLLFPWRWDNWRWSLQAALLLTLVGWLVSVVGTGGVARVMELF